MSNYTSLYWLTRLDGINCLIIVVSCILFLISLGIIIWAAEHGSFEHHYCDENRIKERKALRAKWKRKLRWTIPLGIMFSLIAVFTPTKNEVIFIMAGGKTLDFVEQDTSINKLPAQTTKFISEYLENQINEIKKEPK
jgi:nitrogen fixation-related uncharacterized protein